MIEKARVLSIDGDRVTLSCTDAAGCTSCSSAFCGTKQRSFSAENTKDIELHPNDEVEVYVHPGKAVLAGFMVLIFPLVMFILGFEVAGRFLGMASEAARAGVGALALAGGFGAVFLYNQGRGARSMPEVMRRVSTAPPAGGRSDQA
jgi:sigma-E factor negative regulatory protein RseC